MSFKSTYMAIVVTVGGLRRYYESLSRIAYIVPKDMQRLYITVGGFRWALSNGGVI